MPYMVTFTINIPQMLAYIPYVDPMGIQNHQKLQFCPQLVHKPRDDSYFSIIDDGEIVFKNQFSYRLGAPHCRISQTQTFPAKSIRHIFLSGGLS